MYDTAQTTEAPDRHAGRPAVPRERRHRPARSRPTIPVRLARWSVRHSWAALALWLAFVAAAMLVGSLVSTRTATDADLRVGQSGRADAIAAAAGLSNPLREDVLVRPRAGALPTADAEHALAALTEGLRALPVVLSVEAPVPSPEGSSVLLPVALRGAESSAARHISAVRAVTRQVARAHPNLEIEQAGTVSLDTAVNQRVSDDLGGAERLSLPVTLAILLLAFGALTAAGLPVLLALSGVVATLGIYAPLSVLVPDTGTVSSVVLLVGLAVGVDYSLFVLRRQREERQAGRTVDEAVEVAAATAGHSVLVSGGAVSVSMAGLLVMGDATFTSLAVGAMLVVGVSVLGALTVLPAALSRLGRRVDRPRIPLLWRLTGRLTPGAVSGRLLAPVLRRPALALGVALLAALPLALPALGLHLEQSTLTTLPRDLPEVRTLLAVEKTFPSQGSSFEIAVHAGPARFDRALTGLRSLQRTAGVAGFGSDAASLREAAGRGTAVLTLNSAVPESDPGAVVALDRLRSTLVPQAMQATGAQWAVGGSVAESVDYAAHQKSRLPWVVGFVLGLTLVMMLMAFGSIPLALVTTALNLASVAMSFGVLALVFQHTWAEDLLGFRSSGFVVSWIPLFLFVILVGLSMDYHVFVLSRVREGQRAGLSSRAAVEAGVRSTAGVVTSAAVIMVSVFALFATLSLLEMKQLGVGLAVAILVDATLVRLVMLPAALLLLGRRAFPRVPVG